MDLDTLDTAIERIRWAAGIVELICTDPDTQPQVREAADCAASQLRDARRLLVRLAAPEVKDGGTTAALPEPD